MESDPRQNNSLKEQRKRGSVVSFFQNKKILLLVLTLLVIFVIGFEFRQLKSNIGGPMNISSTERSDCPQGNCEEQQEEAVDTDGDGLTDREEREVYNTSPYLKDTDSDGLTDKEEVERGTDPNCPQGKECGSKLMNPQEEGEYMSGQSATSTPASPKSPASNTPSEVMSATSSGEQMLQQQDLSAENVDQETLKQIVEGEGDASSLRKALREAGMSEELLEQMSDDQLIQSYQQALEKTRGGAQ